MRGGSEVMVVQLGRCLGAGLCLQNIIDTDNRHRTSWCQEAIYSHNGDGDAGMFLLLHNYPANCGIGEVNQPKPNRPRLERRYRLDRRDRLDKMWGTEEEG